PERLARPGPRRRSSPLTSPRAREGYLYPASFLASSGSLVMLMANGSTIGRAAATTNGSTGAAAGAAQCVATSVSALTPCGSSAAPLEGGGRRVPATDRRREPVLQVLPARRMLTRQGAADNDALDRLSQVQPG